MTSSTYVIAQLSDADEGLQQAVHCNSLSLMLVAIVMILGTHGLTRWDLHCGFITGGDACCEDD